VPLRGYCLFGILAIGIYFHQRNIVSAVSCFFDFSNCNMLIVLGRVKKGRPEEGLSYFWITDSCPFTVKEVKNRPPFEVISLAGSIAAALQI